MKVMTEYPADYERCAEDLEYCGACVEEILRYFNPGTLSRYTTTDVAYRDVLLPQGTMLFFPVSIAGRDPTMFDHPHKFDPQRSTAGGRRHIAFGLGKHMCLGQYIARVQIEEGLHLIAQRMGEPRLAGESRSRPFYGVWGLKGLPLEFRDMGPTSAKVEA
jgi:cytochrome P450